MDSLGQEAPRRRRDFGVSWGPVVRSDGWAQLVVCFGLMRLLNTLATILFVDGGPMSENW